ncbi:glucose-1-phosphate adenylyltransferase subunit GlgD [Desulfosporosinus sp. BICA1-9]|uniref:glucose-1-phosphate adenylyltransferase subunit GlgD n=1 Tax=Desulfosporosinus sp. BICA1-9 TaxID=1531958 RepID=UPI00054B7BA2|nr:glucose-1-phosphate adenylyltransferase subunit GlgD [Desulfosporosinus sp. BICA1-9]KJS48936.1 MAG: glucose-1-phosphate adenylyltransferase [Peptococcaceae bacterium BRH_c23]KJS82981.1 MAG: glucose-1-phosphate adenylyltransferase [Desulfosporosinus sp. BICA1-9]HBW33866.1 glucose-1-phosphate adenylyltransferase subunit GlgD [Desulfosporosinus sp.]
MHNAIGILFGNNSSDILQGLAFQRSIAAVPFGGRYRLLDFALSSMVNSGIRTIGLVTPRHYRSLLDHLGAGKEWFLDRKSGGLFILPGAIQGLSGQSGKFRLKDLQLNIEYLQKEFCENIIISGCNHVFNINYQAALEIHESKRADITLIYKESTDSVAMAGKEHLIIGDNQEVLDILGNDTAETSGQTQAYFVDMLIIRRKLLLELIEGYRSIETVNLMDAIYENIRSLKLFGVPFKGYFGTVNSVKDYFDRSMELLNPEIRKEVLTGQDQIHTKIVDNPPTKHGAQAKVSNSLISSGCTIEGEVHNSILARGVIVESGAVIRNCIIMQKCKIEAEASLNYVILDKFVKVHAGNVLKGNKNTPLVVLKGSLV